MSTPITIAIFLATVAGVAGVFWAGTGRSLRVLAALAGWLAFTGALAARGLLLQFTPPPPMIGLLVVALVAVAWLAVSPLGKKLSMSPIAWLVGFQVFRVPVEIVLYRLHHEGLVPVQMMFEGLNYDILSGLTALPVAWLAARNRLPGWGLFVWNVAGLALVLNITIVALLSLPLPIRVFMNEPANTIVATFPFVWLPTLLVPAALVGHLLVFRRLWMTRPATGTLHAKDVAAV